MVLTAASVIGSDTVVSVFLDPGRRVLAPVVSVDESQGTAALLIPVGRCPRRCAPATLAADTAVVNAGDSVIAVGAAWLTAGRPQPRGAVATVNARRLVASLRLGDRGAGAPVLRADGQVVGIARSAERQSTTVAAAAGVRAFLARAQSDRARRRLRPIDSLPPSWPARALSTAEVAEGYRRTEQSLDAYRVNASGFAIMVMTPQVLAARKTLADTLRRYFDPVRIEDRYCGEGDTCDPLEAWGPGREYLAERRGVVVIQVSPDSAPPPFTGQNRRVIAFRQGSLSSLTLTRDGTPVVPIESARIYAVPNVSKYPAQPAQRRAPYSGIYVYSALDFAAPGRYELAMTDELRPRNPAVRALIPDPVLQAVRRDLGSVIGEARRP
jgi:hypothetical protein